MTECPKCGTQNRDEAIYCRSCGATIQDTVYVKPQESLGIVHIGIILIAVVMLIASFGMIMGGTSLRTIQDLVVDEEGFITSDPAEIDVSGYAIVLEDMDFDVDPVAWRWFQRRGGLFTLRVITKSNDPSKEIFIGIAEANDISAYLDDVEYQRVIDANFELDNYDLALSDSDFVLHPGGAPSVPPTVHSYWVTHAVSTDLQELRWEPEAGNYYAVIMNADGSDGIKADVQIGVKIPVFGSIGNILLTVGLFFGGIAVLLLYFTLRRS